jgi:lipoprotein-releasing system ATP-binding protein
MLAELRNVTKSYANGDTAVPVLTGCDFSVDFGETVGIVGPSGSGKSTLLNLLGALDQPEKGEVIVAGKNLAALKPDELAVFRNSEVGFVFQLHHLLPHCNVLENVLVPTLARKVAKAERTAFRERAAILLEAVGLSHRLDHRPGQLSGGERQRVAVARALITSPKLLLADEPTGALDRDNAIRLTDLIAEINQREKVAVVMVTHAPDLAKRMSRVMELRGGKFEGVTAP